jgi:hypothetical protein
VFWLLAANFAVFVNRALSFVDLKFVRPVECHSPLMYQVLAEMEVVAEAVATCAH